jgi:Protein of unknown function (DUF2892)
MRTNMARWDRIVRSGVGIALLALGWSGVTGGVPGRVLGIVCILFAVLQLGTGLTGYCPMYAVLGRSTKRS